MFKIYEGVFKTNYEPESPNESTCLRYMLNPNHEMRELVMNRSRHMNRNCQ